MPVLCFVSTLSKCASFVNPTNEILWVKFFINLEKTTRNGRNDKSTNLPELEVRGLLVVLFKFSKIHNKHDFMYFLARCQ